MKQTRNAVRAIQQSLLLGCLWTGENTNSAFDKLAVDILSLSNTFSDFFKVMSPNFAIFSHSQTYFWVWVHWMASKACPQEERWDKGVSGLAPSNVCGEKGSLLSFVYKFGWVACQCS
jgi:hypothetical protein